MRRRDPNNLVLWGGVVLVGILAVVLVWNAGGFRFTNPRSAIAGTAKALPQVAPSPTVTSTPSKALEIEAEAVSEAIATPVPAPSGFLQELPEVTPPPGGQVYTVAPVADAVGWVQEGDETLNHFGDYNIYAGVFEGQRRLGGIQFDLSGIPAGVPIAYADLTLVGLSEEWQGNGGVWTVQLLESWLDGDWPQRTFADLALGESVAAGLDPALAVGDVAAGRGNVFVLGPQALEALEARTFTGLVSFRIDGPASGEDNLFSWDSGYGTQSMGWKPVLRLVAGPLPDVIPEPPTPAYVIITSSPTPENVVTEAAIAATAAVISATTGTVTPLPLNWVTPVIIVPTPVPANVATAQWHAALATAEVSLHGTPTRQPPNAWTVTPVSTVPAVIVTSSPTPANWSTAIAHAAAEATRFATAGPPTRFPTHVVTATPRRDYVFAVVTSTPTPENWATSSAIRARATIVALSKGTYTPVPLGWVTPTPLPLLIPFNRLTATALPTPTPGRIPNSLRGRIGFYSDRLGRTELFVMDPDGRNVAWLTRSFPYEWAREREPIAPDGQRRVIVQEDDRRTLQLYLYDSAYGGVQAAITRFTGSTYDAAWAPDRDVIAFVSTEPGNDELYTVNVDGSHVRRLTTNTWEWDKHPTWSPDGTQIAFFSNRGTGRTQIWVMNANGSGQRNISSNEYNDWNPVWFK